MNLSTCLLANNILVDGTFEHKIAIDNSCSLYVTNCFLDSTKILCSDGGILVLDSVFFSENYLIGDYMWPIANSSILVDAGIDFFVTELEDTIFAPENDFFSNPRPFGDGYDIGAFEYVPGNPPYIASINDTSVLHGDTLEIVFFAIDPDGDEFDLEIIGFDDYSLTYDSDTALLSLFTSAEHIGLHEISIIACDSSLCDTQAFVIDVFNEPPVIIGCPADTILMYSGVFSQMTFSIYDQNPELLIYEILSAPEIYEVYWHDTVFSEPGNLNLQIEFLPPIDTTCVYNFVYQVCDVETCITCSFVFKVINEPPVFINCSDDTAIIPFGKLSSLWFFIDDTNPEVIDYEILSAPDLAELFWSDSAISEPGRLYLTFEFLPLMDSTGIYDFAFQVCDFDTCVTCSFVVRVVPPGPIGLELDATLFLPEEIGEIDTLVMWDSTFITVKGEEHTWLLRPEDLTAYDCLDFVDWLDLADVDSDYVVDWLKVVILNRREIEGFLFKSHLNETLSVRTSLNHVNYACKPFGKVYAKGSEECKIIIGSSDGRPWSFPLMGISCGLFAQEYGFEGKGLFTKIYDSNLNYIGNLPEMPYPFDISGNQFASFFHGDIICETDDHHWPFCEKWTTCWGVHHFNYEENTFDLDIWVIKGAGNGLGGPSSYYIPSNPRLGCYQDSITFTIVRHKRDLFRLYLSSEDYYSHIDSALVISTNYLSLPWALSFIYQSHDTLRYFELIDDSLQMFALDFLPPNETMVKAVIDGENVYLLTKNHNILKSYIIHRPEILRRGWNLLSYPKLDTVSVREYFPSIIPPAFAWHNTTTPHHYVALDSVFGGFGFWMASEIDTVYSHIRATGGRITITLYPGWNLIGCPDRNVPAAIITDYPEVITNVFEYDYQTDYYIVADTLRPGYGYWVAAMDTVEIEMP